MCGRPRRWSLCLLDCTSGCVPMQQGRLWSRAGRRTAEFVKMGCRHRSASAADALAAMRTRAEEAAHRAGFVDRRVQLPSGEPLTFLERPPASGGAAQSVVVFLHGMTNDRMMSAASFAKAAEQLPHARCLLPDAAGHGGRMEWAMQDSHFSMSADGHVSDFEAVLQAMLTAGEARPQGGLTCSQREQETFAPIDLIGYSMGGSTAFRFAAQHSHRVRNIALLAPALMLHDDQVAATAAAAQTGCNDDVVYNYSSEEQALEFCRVVGWPAANAKRLAPMLVAGREGHPSDYWARIWLSFAGAYDAGDTAGARSALDLFVSHMQAVAQFGVQLRAARQRVLVVQGTEELVVEPQLPKLLEETLGDACERHDLPGVGHRGHPMDAKEDFLNPACRIAGEWLAGKVGNA